jgi:hypothetical protein
MTAVLPLVEKKAENKWWSYGLQEVARPIEILKLWR